MEFHLYRTVEGRERSRKDMTSFLEWLTFVVVVAEREDSSSQHPVQHNLRWNLSASRSDRAHCVRERVGQSSLHDAMPLIKASCPLLC